MPSEEEQKAVDKCIKQLTDQAAQNTVLRAKRIILQFVCRDHCHMTQNKLNELRTKDELYAAAAAWVRAQQTSENFTQYSDRWKKVPVRGGRLCKRGRQDLLPVPILFLGRTLWRPSGRTWPLLSFPSG